MDRSNNKNKPVVQPQYEQIPSEFPKGKVRPLQVEVNGSSRDDFEYSVKRFKYLFQKERIVGQLKEKSAFEKPSAKKRRKRREAKDRQLLATMREKQLQSGEWERRQKRKERKRQQREDAKRQNRQNGVLGESESSGVENEG
jgi:ribosomal protein S21